MIRALLGNAEWLATGYRVHDLRARRPGRRGRARRPPRPRPARPGLGRRRGACAACAREPDAPIGEALLDQRNLAGIGNLYKCEVLFIERRQPVDAGRRRRRPRRAWSTPRSGCCGPTATIPSSRPPGYTGRGREHWVYERGGQPCRRCRTPIQRAEQGAAAARPQHLLVPALPART